MRKEKYRKKPMIKERILSIIPTLEEEKHNFDIKITEGSLNEIIEDRFGSDSKENEEEIQKNKQIKISELSEENTKKLLSRASKDISSKDDDEKEFFMRGK